MILTPMGIRSSQHDFVSLQIDHGLVALEPPGLLHNSIYLDDSDQIAEFVRAMPGLGARRREIFGGGWLPVLRRRLPVGMARSFGFGFRRGFNG